jgi:hypothetical protein
MASLIFRAFDSVPSREEWNMAATLRLRVEVEDDVLMVTLPGTTFRVIYSKPKKSSALVAFGVRGDKDAGMSQVDFLTRAWSVANHKARELGWIV